MLWRSLEVLKLFSPPADATTPHYQDVRESAEAMHFYADELLESATTSPTCSSPSRRRRRTR
jgi:hypothetical protein